MDFGQYCLPIEWLNGFWVTNWSLNGLKRQTTLLVGGQHVSVKGSSNGFHWDNLYSNFWISEWLSYKKKMSFYLRFWNWFTSVLNTARCWVVQLRFYTLSYVYSLLIFLIHLLVLYNLDRIQFFLWGILAVLGPEECYLSVFNSGRRGINCRTVYHLEKIRLT